jgi:murein DD-endopeptidase MepM/ murein hydrolase activator NlpD
MAAPKYVTIMLVPEGTEARTGWRMRQWVLRSVVIGIVVLVVVIILFFAFYGAVLSRAARTEQVIKENQDLKRYYYKVQLLEQNLHQAREAVTRLAHLAGVDFQLPELPDDSTLFAELAEEVEDTSALSTTPDWSLPAGLPIQGFVTQQFQTDDPAHYHPGVDIACAVGTPVLATGSGMVEYVAFDSTYGNMIVLRHNDSVTTVYGHNDRVLAVKGQRVRVGSRIAESGNSGISSAPHLHYEMRIHGEPINPLDNPYDQEN